MTLEVIIPAYNCVSTLPRTLDSLVAQSNPAFTVLLVDDCSTQDLTKIVDSYQGKLSIRYIRNETNVGCGMTRQRGMDETKADYITFLDSDDILLPGAIDTWLTEIDRTSPEVIYSPFFYATGGEITLRKSTFAMCHGKAYNINFLRKYDIREHESVKCEDDIYLNWQVFDLAQNISLLREPTYVQIDTAGSVTNTREFRLRVLRDNIEARELAREKIARFRSEPFSNYYKVRKQAYTMLQIEEPKYRIQMDEIQRTTGGFNE